MNGVVGAWLRCIPRAKHAQEPVSINTISATIYNFKDCRGRKYRAHAMKILYAQWFKSTGNRMEQDYVLEKLWSGTPCPPQSRLERPCGI